MGAVDLNFGSRFGDYIRMRLIDLETQTNTWGEREKEGNRGRNQAVILIWVKGYYQKVQIKKGVSAC